MRCAIVVIVVATTGVAAADPPRRLRKSDVRPALKAIMPKVSSCYAVAHDKDPRIAGVVNTKLTIRSDAVGLAVNVRGFDTHGTLGASREFLACVTTAFESAKSAAIAVRGTLDMTYPTTFAPTPVDNKDTSSVTRASRALDQGRFAEAFAEAEKGLELTSIDGAYRRPLIAIAGQAACELENRAKARAYYELAPEDAEERLEKTCAKHGIALR